MLRIADDGPVQIWTIDRPEVKNAIGEELIDAIARAAVAAEADPTRRAIVLTGDHGIFASGGDLRELERLQTDADLDQFRAAGERLVRSIRQLRVPVIAAINGPAIGGGAELAAACDLRIGDASTSICFKHIRMGITPAWSTVSRLVELVGAGHARRLLYTAHTIDCREASAIGLLDGLAHGRGALGEALDWAHAVSDGAPAAVESLKAMLEAYGREATQSLGRAEARSFEALWFGPDRAEAFRAMRERRPPHFTDTRRADTRRGVGGSAGKR